MWSPAHWMPSVCEATTAKTAERSRTMPGWFEEPASHPRRDAAMETGLGAAARQSRDTNDRLRNFGPELDTSNIYQC